MSQNEGLGDLATKLNGQRLHVIVKDSAGKPVGNLHHRLYRIRLNKDGYQLPAK